MTDLLGWLGDHWPQLAAAWLLASYPAARAIARAITVRDRHEAPTRKD